MNILHLRQGSDEWKAIRPKYNVSSDAAAMLGYDKRLSRNELLRMRATGDAKEFSEWEQKFLLDKGHDIEDHVRRRKEDIECVTFYPVTGTNGRLLASFDGINLDDDGRIGLEVKSWNVDLVAAVRAGDVPDTHWPQLEQQILVGGLKEVLFVVADGADREVQLVYKSIPERREQLLRGWLQFSEDLANYKLPEYIPADPVGNAQVSGLPVLAVQTEGRVVASNFEAFELAYMEKIDGIRTEGLETDQDFADAEATAKLVENARGELKAMVRLVRGQTVDIDKILSGMERLDGALQKKHSRLVEQITERKQRRRAAIVEGGRTRLAEHIATINTRLGKPLMPMIDADFAGAVRSKRSFKSMQEEVDSVLARAKIEAHRIADRITDNLKLIEKDGYSQYAGLFSDLQAIAHKPTEDFAAIVHQRIRSHEEAQDRARREAERKAAEARQAAPAANTAAPVASVAPAQSSRAPGPLDMPRPISTRAGGVPWPGAKGEPPRRPSDETIVQTVADAFRVDVSTAVEWLKAIDFAALATADLAL